jgi:hypothetical protein
METNQIFIVSNDFVGARHGFHHKNLIGIEMFDDMFLKLNLCISCMIFVLVMHNHLLHHSSHHQLKLKLQKIYMA